ncbi:hypothetical protein PENSTE_c011G01643 [Penicillium steckii]|uniref:Fungal N-terminal domain-containing protein n=1 Tax=Penicillium steckii TaxID=303698 RepID=A0A1V6T6I0_9EURO|nr:hypothetical protein PENSTE_c011G01643 [Penicillium steckii]
MSDLSETVTNYSRARDSFAESLSEWSNALAEDPKCADRVCQLLDGLIAEIELLRDLGNMNAANVCFQHRCQVIKYTIEDASDILKVKSHSTSEIAELITMIGVQVGRLTLIPFDRKDATVVAMDKMASELDARMGSVAIRDDSITPFLRDMWRRLHFPVGDCQCLQCYRLAASRRVVSF